MEKNPESITPKKPSKECRGDSEDYKEDDWIKSSKTDDPCDPMLPMSNPGDKDYEC